MTTHSQRPLRALSARSASRDIGNLIGLAIPGAGFGIALAVASQVGDRWVFLADVTRWPWQLWCIAAFGAVGAAGGIGDWVFHRRFVAVGPKERRSHRLALYTGGVPMLGLMIAATAFEARWLLIPIIGVALWTTALICYDEFVFHRQRCSTHETWLHRMTVFGNGAAWLAWVHYCFVAEVAHVS